MKAVIALIAHEGKPTNDGRVISEVTIPDVTSPQIPVLDGRPGHKREVIGSAYVRLEEGATSRGVIAHCTIYDDAVRALLAPSSPLRLVADMTGEVLPVDPQEYALVSLTDPPTWPERVRYRITGDVRSVTVTAIPAWDDLWVREDS